MHSRFKSNLSLILAALLVVSVLGACASSGGGAAEAPAAPPAEEVIEGLLMGVLDMLKSGDVDGMMASYSDDFTWDQGDKASMQGFLQGAVDGGFMDGMTADTSARAIAVDGDTATAEGVSIEGAFGLLDLSFELANRDGEWIVTKQMQQ
ncbi:MAG: hypothetical protein AAF637_28210 [Pseudomonadota bacterium]